MKNWTQKRILYSTQLRERESSPNKLVLWHRKLYYATLEPTLQSDDVIARVPATCVKSNAYGKAAMSQTKIEGRTNMWCLQHRDLMKLKENRIKKLIRWKKKNFCLMQLFNFFSAPPGFYIILKFDAHF